MSNTRNPANVQDVEQQREHTGLRTLDAHYSAEQVYQACHCEYPGTGVDTNVLAEKRRQRAQASNERAKASGIPADAGATSAGDRSGESEASL
jgi:hypothetical protein